MGSSATWETIMSSAVGQASAWMGVLEPVLVAFIALGIVALAIGILKRGSV